MLCVSIYGTFPSIRSCDAQRVRGGGGGEAGPTKSHKTAKHTRIFLVLSRVNPLVLKYWNALFLASIFCQGAKYALMCGVRGLGDLNAPIPKCATQTPHSVTCRRRRRFFLEGTPLHRFCAGAALATRSAVKFSHRWWTH